MKLKNRFIKPLSIVLGTFGVLLLNAWLGGLFTGTSPVWPLEISPTPTSGQIPASSPTVVLPTHSPTPSSTTTVIIERVTRSTSTPTVSFTSTAMSSSISPLPPAQASSFAPCVCGRACPCPIKYVVIISIDGLRPDALEQADTPTLDALRAQGAYSPAAQAVGPSVTLVNHASMLSGMSPEKHGIYWNSNNPNLGKVKGPTVFSVAHAAGLSTAMVAGKPKLEHLVLPHSVDTYIYAGFTDRQVVNRAVTVIQEDMPDLLFIHLPDVDSAGHSLGWVSIGQLLTISWTDSVIGEIVAALDAQNYFDQTLLIITADHGGTGYTHGSDSPEDMTIPWLAVGPGLPAGVTLQSKIITYDTAATALNALGLSIPTEWDGKPVLEIFDEPAPH